MGTPREKQPSAKIQWHPAFCAAAELELRSNKGDLEFKREYNLSKKPLQMDLLIIEKRKGVQFQDARICLPVQRLRRKGEPNSAKRIDCLTFSSIYSKRTAKSAF